jgi:hypothetical protein
LKSGAAAAIFRAVTNPLQNKYLVRGVWCAAALLAGCGGRHRDQAPVPRPTIPLPTAGIAGQVVSVFPLTLVAAEDSLHWETRLTDRAASLAAADSIIGSLLRARVTEVTWVLPEELRRAARRAPAVATDPDHLSTSLLRAENIQTVPDPLRSQLRTLEAIAGGRFALIPAALIYRRAVGLSDSRTGNPPNSPTVRPSDRPIATAELSIVLVDVRLGRIGWRSVARGEGDDPWTALTRAMKALTPGLP